MLVDPSKIDSLRKWITLNHILNKKRPGEIKDGAIAMPRIFYEVNVLNILDRFQSSFWQEHKLVAIQLPSR